MKSIFKNEKVQYAIFCAVAFAAFYWGIYWGLR